MDKNAFKQFCNEFFLKYGFKKYKSAYYRSKPQELLCSLRLDSSYGEGYYVACHYFVGDFNSCKEYPSRYDFDLADRPIVVMSKTTYQGEHFLTALIEYKEYTEQELQPYFEKAFQTRIMPPLLYGKAELLRHIEDWHFPHHTIKSEQEVLDKLKK